MIRRRARAKRPRLGYAPGIMQDPRGNYTSLNKGKAVGFDRNIHGMYLEGTTEETDDYIQRSIG